MLRDLKFVNLRRYSHHSRLCVHQFIILISWFLLLLRLDSTRLAVMWTRTFSFATLLFYFILLPLVPCFGYGYWILLEINLILCSIIMRPFSSPLCLLHFTHAHVMLFNIFYRPLDRLLSSDKNINNNRLNWGYDVILFCAAYFSIRVDDFITQYKWKSSINNRALNNIFLDCDCAASW